MRLAILLLAAAVAALVAQGAELPPGTVRLAVLSDTHMAGPEYPLNGENGPLDNASITKTQQRMWRVVRAINAIEPKPTLALFGGDVVHNGIEYLEEAYGLTPEGLQQLFDEPVNGFKIAQAILSELKAPQLFMWGNHDNLVHCGKPEKSAPKDITRAVYQTFFNATPWAARDVGGWKVVALDSMYGYTWNATDPRCNDRLSSYGEEQLRWLDAQLAEGKPSVVMMHFPPATSVVDEVNTTEAWRDLGSVLSAHNNAKLVLSGHFHKGLDWEDLYPFPAYIVPSTRYNPQNYFVIDLHQDGTFEFNMDKNRNGSRCSDWWTYAADGPVEGEYEAAVQPKDGGDCGMPAANLEAELSFPLGPVMNKNAIPSQDVFNPEGACRFVLFAEFLEACAGGASADCCEVVADATRLSSSAPFSTCLCQPSFWAESEAYLQERHGQDLSKVLSQCVSYFKKLIVWRGGPLTWCPAAAGGASQA